MKRFLWVIVGLVLGFTAGNLSSAYFRDEQVVLPSGVTVHIPNSNERPGKIIPMSVSRVYEADRVYYQSDSQDGSSAYQIVLQFGDRRVCYILTPR